jgi:3-oxoacyl-[acyl-carrier protein] reductase
MTNSSDAYDLTGRVAVVTGAGSGIGAASSALLASAGATVVCCDIDGEKARATAKEIANQGNAASPELVDVSDRAAVDAVVHRTMEAHGRIDIMANIAGVMRQVHALDMTDDDLELVLAVNLRGVVYGCQAVARVMVEAGRGSIVNMGSGSIDIPCGDLLPYVIAKSGVVQLTRTFAFELAPRGVRVNVVSPGYVLTPMSSRLFTDAEGHVDEELKAATLAHMASVAPLGRVGQPEDIARTVLFLASDASSFMTGQTVRPNGGASMPW